MANWAHPNLIRFAQAACESGMLYYLKGRGGYAAEEGDLQGFEAFLPLWTSEKAAEASRCGPWERFVIRPVTITDLTYFKDDFVMNGWAAHCYLEDDDQPVEAPLISVVAAIAREKGRRRVKATTIGSRSRARSSASQFAAVPPLMPSRLRTALERFIARAKAHGVPGHVSAICDLDAFDAKFPGIMPRWYRDVLAFAPIGDITFTAANSFGRGWTSWGHFRDAQTLVVELDGAFPDDELSRNGYLSLGAAGDGDCWVIRSSSGPDDPVFLCNQSAYGTGDPADSKGCLFKHSECFPAFLDEILILSDRTSRKH